MFSLQDLLGQQQGSQAVNQMSQAVGADQNAVNNVISMALPVIVGAMAQKAQQPETAPQITNAITQEPGSILDNLGALTGNINPTASAGILGSILGNRQGQVAQEISNKSGLSMGQVASILMMLAPLVMGYFGRQQTQRGLDPGGIIDMLGGQQQQIQKQSPSGGILDSLIDRNNDGSSLDDLAGLAMQYLGRR